MEARSAFVKRAAAALLGVLLPALAFALWAPPWRAGIDGWDNYYLDTYPLDFAIQPKHLVIATGCWTWTTEAYMPLGSDHAKNTQKAALHNVLNAILDERGGPEERFYAFGRPEVDFERHLVSIHQALRQGAVRSLIYINNPGSLQAFTRPADTVAALPVLEAIRRDYPGLAADIRIFRDALLASRGYREGAALEAAKPVWQRVSEPLKQWADGIARRWQGVRSNLAFSPLPDHRDRGEIEALFRETRDNYDNPAACAIKGRSPMAPGRYWIGAGGDAVWQAWLRIAAGMTAARGVSFVYYVPPHLNVTEDRYRREFRPHFVERVRTVLAPFANAQVIDHAVGHGLSACDQVYDSEHHFAAGYLFNLAGKLKQSRRLLESLGTLGILAGGGERYREPTRWEAALPPLPSHPAAVLSEEESAPLREELIGEEQWRLSRPAAEEGS